jgi:AraC-like DNA-binding protein
MILIREGECELRIEENTYPLKPEDMAFISEGEYHHMRVRDHCTYHFIDFRPMRIFIHPDLLNIFLGPFLKGRNGGSHKWRPDVWMLEAVEDLIWQATEQKEDILKVTRRIIALVEHFRKITPIRDDPLETLRQKLRPAVGLIYQQYQEPLSVEKLAKACAMSRTTFYRHFTTVYGRNPKAFLNDLRFDYALNLLSTSKRKISDIALSTGFFNLSHFNRTFLKKCSMTPKAYRERNLN